MATSEAASRSGAAPTTSRGTGDSGLSSTYYYAAVPSGQRTLPVCAPPRVKISDAGQLGAQQLLPQSSPQLSASGAVKADIDSKGANSYYYAHARTKDYHVPTVPMRIETNGSLSPWVPPSAVGNPNSDRK